MGFALVAAIAALAASTSPTLWRVDSTSAIAGHTPRVIGAPKVIDAPHGKVVAFDGVGDGLIVPVNPLAGASAFTIEIHFRPDADGPAEQRFLHVEDEGGARALIETRLTTEGNWALDTFLMNGANRLPLLDRTLLHPCGEWAWAALRYDGRQMTSFVNGTKEMEGPVTFPPMLKIGRTSVGVRLNEVYWFKGAIGEVRFHSGAIPAEELQRPSPPPRKPTEPAPRPHDADSSDR